MPKKIKLIFSAVVLIVAALGAWFLSWIGQETAPWLAIFLGVFSVVSVSYTHLTLPTIGEV